MVSDFPGKFACCFTFPFLSHVTEIDHHSQLQSLHFIVQEQSQAKPGISVCAVYLEDSSGVKGSLKSGPEDRGSLLFPSHPCMEGEVRAVARTGSSSTHVIAANNESYKCFQQVFNFLRSTCWNYGWAHEEGGGRWIHVTHRKKKNTGSGIKPPSS